MLSKKWLLVILVLVLVVAVGAFLAGRMGMFTPSAPVVEVETEARVMREVILYFGDPLGEYLVAEHREMPDCPANEQCVQMVLDALIRGPADTLIPVVPPQTSLLQVILDEQTVTLDFSRDLVTRHPGGSISELLTVYGIANTLAVNFPHLRQVRILVAGQSVESLKGHVDLRAPVPADFRYGRPPFRAGEEGRLGAPVDRSVQ